MKLLGISSVNFNILGQLLCSAETGNGEREYVNTQYISQLQTMRKPKTFKGSILQHCNCIQNTKKIKWII